MTTSGTYQLSSSQLSQEPDAGAAGAVLAATSGFSAGAGAGAAACSGAGAGSGEGGGGGGGGGGAGSGGPLPRSVWGWGGARPGVFRSCRGRGSLGCAWRGA